MVVTAQLLGLVMLGALLAVAPSGDPTTRDLVVGAASGVCGGIGVFLLFRGLAAGRMSVVAPITAVGAAVLPVGWGLATGERPSPVVLFGVVLALAAVVLVVAVLALATKQALVPEPDARGHIAGSAIFDVTANAVYLLAVRRGLLSLVAVLSALYPAVTVLLARVVLGERLVRTQVYGLSMAALGVLLIATG